MFPLDFPLAVLGKDASANQWVLDPFCGRGTTNYASRILGMPSIGIDASRVAIAAAQAKLANTSPKKILMTATAILAEGREPRSIPQGEFWEWAYHKDVLHALCKLREELLQDCRSDSRRALRAIILGALHGPKRKSKKSYFSNQCPRTYGPKPKYAVKFWKLHDSYPENMDVLQVIEERSDRYYGNESAYAEGKIIAGDSRKRNTFSEIPKGVKFDWVITSPPYYGMNTYISDQWLRLWFLGGKAEVTYSQEEQMKHSSPEAFSGELRQVWRNVASVSNSRANLVIRFGGINSRKVPPKSIIEKSLEQSGWQVEAIISAGSASKGRRQANHFSIKKSEPIDELDVWATLQDNRN